MNEQPHNLVLSPELEAEVLRLFLEYGGIHAIKKIVQSTGSSIQEAYGWINQRVGMMTLCPYCGEPLATDKARQCFKCGKDWHGEA